MPLRAVRVVVECAGFVGRMLRMSVSLGDGTAFVGERRTCPPILLGESMVPHLGPRLEHIMGIVAV
jgi:hypothetical protein